MGTSDAARFIGGTQDKGINTFEPDITTEITLDETTNNVTGGLRRGVGPRVGVAPVPGHADSENPTGTRTNGLMRAEGTGGAGLINRELVFGCVPILMTPYDGAYPKANQQFYAWLVGLDDSSNVCLDACLGATLSSSVNKQASDLRAGLAESSYREESPLVRRHKTEMLNLSTIATPTAADMRAILRRVASTYWIPSAHISISGKRIPYQWMLADTTSTPDATTGPNLNLWTIPITGGSNPTIYGGAPSEIATREARDNNQRQLNVFCLLVTGFKLDIKYAKTITDANTAAVMEYGTADHYTGLTSASKSGASVAYNTVSCALINDPGSYTNSKHEAILIAGEKPLAIVYQDWLQAAKGMMPRWVDLSSPGCAPLESRSFQTAYAKASSLINNISTFGQQPANTGILRKDVTYDFGWSIYNKLLDFETNVVFGRTNVNNADDFYAIVVVSTGNGPNVWEIMQSGLAYANPWDFSETASRANGETPRALHLNDYEYRFYYRENGTEEWLPAGSFDCAQFWFKYDWPQIGTTGGFGPPICMGPSGALPGGRADGFIDYSTLPKQRYICASNFKNRAFWWSEKTMQFSLQNNIYAYPTRNIIAAQSGSWRGGIVHTKLGEGQATASRLVVFASDRTYACAFTGNKLSQNVRVSFDTIGQFDVDGSDFEMDYLSDSTAWSFRAACVAEGILYWWGAQGVHRDDGIGTPEKISGPLEPDLFRFVDTGRIEEIHSVYNKTTKEIFWFYPPKITDANFPTYMLIYNITNGNFYFGKMRCQVDSAQNIKIERDTTPDAIDGERVLLHVRETAASTVQRSFFFDELCKSGEQGPARELLIKTISTPTTGQRRLTKASGSVSLATIAVGDLIAIQNAKDYAPSLTSTSDLIAKVTAVNNGAGTLDILLPDGAVFDAAATLSAPEFFPIYHKGAALTAAGLHGITYQFQTNYWTPTGPVDSWYWQYLYFLFKYLPWKATTGAQIALAYRTLRAQGFASDVLTLSDNSDGHAQIHHMLQNAVRGANGAATGQALKYRLSGVHIGHDWTLEYLEAHCQAETGFSVREFEG